MINKKVIWIIGIAAILIALTLVKTCGKDDPQKPNPVIEVKNNVNASEVVAKKTFDSLNAIAANSMRVIDSLVVSKKVTESKLNIASKAATMWANRYAELISKKDTAGAIVACDSLKSENEALTGAVDYYRSIFDSSVTQYETVINAERAKTASQVELNKQLRAGFDKISNSYDSLYSSNTHLRQRFTIYKAASKVKTILIIAGAAYTLVHILK